MTPRRAAAPPAIPPLAERQRPPLSATLAGPFTLLRCSGCGRHNDTRGEGASWTRWVECDPQDQPTSVALTFCVTCRRTVMEPHPRLYRALDRHAPFPGAMPLCLTCTHRGNQQGITCTSPLQLRLGGPGMAVRFPPATPCHVNYGGGRGEFVRLYTGPVTGCAGYDGPDESAPLIPLARAANPAP